MAPDWPRLPPAYAFAIPPLGLDGDGNAPPAALRAKATLSLRDGPPWEETFRAAVALTLGAHAGEPTYAFGIGNGGQVHGELGDGDTVAALLDGVRRENPERGDYRLVIDFGSSSAPQSTALLLVVSETSRANADVVLHFDATILSPLEADWFLSHLSTAFGAISSASPTTEISQLSLLAPGEHEMIASLSHSPSPPSAYPPSCTTLPSFFLHSSASTSHAVALQFDTTTLSYAQLEHLARRFAQRLLADARVRPGTIVPVCVSKSIEMVVAMLGILLAGCGYLNLEPSFPAGRKEGILRELRGTDLWSGAAVLVAGSGEEEIWSAWKEDGDALVRTIDVTEIVRPLLASLDTIESDFPLDDTPFPTPSSSDPAYLIYTSGSTGAPKGIVVEHRNVAAFLRNYRGVFGRAPGERVLQFPSYSFDVSVMNIWDTFAHGATLCMTSQSALLSDLADAILRLECTLVDLTPTIGALLFEHPEAQPRDGESVREAWERAGFRIKVVNTGGEKVERWVRDAWLERGVRVVIDYGPSETTVGVISNQNCSSDSPVVPIGRPTGENVLHILSPSLELVPLGCIGEICVGGAQVTRGYVKRELDAAVFVEHPKLGRIYRTGDLGRFLADGEGNIECLGRRDGQVKVNGLRIEVGEIEQHLTTTLHPSLVRGVVDRLESDSLAPGLIAFLILSPNFSTSPFSSLPVVNSAEPFILPIATTSEFRTLVDAVKARLATSLPPYMIPRYWLPVSRIPTQGMGKADRKSLKRLAEAHDFSSRGSHSTSTSRSQRRDEWHDAVRTAWARVLRVDKENLDDRDSFTKMGGDSIGFMKVVAVLREAGHRVSFAALADATDLTACAEVLQRTSSSNPSSPSPPSFTTPFSLVPLSSHAAIFAELAAEHALPSSDIADFYPTAPSQDAILSASLDSTHYYAQAVYALDNSLSVDVVTNALVQLVKRHPALRTCFVVLQAFESTLQVVLSEASEQVRDCVKVRVVRCDAPDVQRKVDEWLDLDRSVHEFRWGLLALSFAIIIGSDDSRKLVWSMHHAMSDGWTLELLTTDLRAICHGLPVLDRPPFAAVVAWSVATREPPPETQTFWKEYLMGSKPLGWPLRASAGEPFSTSTVAQLHWTGDLAALSKRHGVTPAIASRVAIAVALSQHAGSLDLSLGIVRSGRDIDLDGADAIVGPCVSVLPSRLLLASSPSLLDLASSESASDRRIRAHQNISLSRLFRLCDLPDRSALFDVLVTYQSFAERDEEEETKASWPIKQPPSQIRMPTNYALSFEVTPFRDDPDALELACFFDGQVATPEEVNTILNKVARVLDVLTTAPCTLPANLKLDLPTSRPPRSSNHGATGAKAPHSRISADQHASLDKIRLIWSEVLRVKSSELAADDLWASVGGDSIAMMRLSAKLKKAGIAIPVQRLATLPTLKSQAEWIAGQM